MANSQMSAMERILYLLDDHSFVELGSCISSRNTDFNTDAARVRGDGVITGYGLLDGRMVYVCSQDASLLGGSVGEMHARKINRIYDLAMKNGAPVILMLDCAGLRLREAYDALHAFGSIFYQQVKASGVIVTVAGVFGMSGGGSAVMSSLSDFTMIVKDKGCLFVNSPNTFDSKADADTASAAYQAAKAGTVDYLAESEEDLLDRIRELLSVLPSSYDVDDVDPKCEDDLNRIIPELNEREYDPAYTLRQISDDHFFFETKKEYGKDMITGFIRLGGQTVGVAANAADGEGALIGSAGLRKAARLIRFCDAFSIPILTLTNVEGLKASEHEERRLAEAMAQFSQALASATVARVNLITGSALGTAGIIMNSGAIGADFVLAWPQARIGMMDSERAVRIIYDHELDRQPDQMSFLDEKTREYEEMQNSAYAAAGRGYIDDVIEPDASRKRLIMAFEMLAGKKMSGPDKKHPAM